MGAAHYLVGIDEVGRGPLAGPLCVGACLIRKQLRRKVTQIFRGVRECKQLSFQQRIDWFARIAQAMREGAIVGVTSFVSQMIIDRDGLTVSLSRAIARCLKKLSVPPERTEVLLDGGIYAPSAYVRQKTIIRGDAKEPLIALASIVAKVRRDRYMIRLARRFPQYGFETHKGYGTKQHYEALRKYGISPIHRVSFLGYLKLPILRVTNLKIKNQRLKRQCKI